MTRFRRAVAAFAVAGACVAGPYVEVAYKCRAPESEACVWAKAYLPLSLGVAAFIGLGAGLAAWFALAAFARRRLNG